MPGRCCPIQIHGMSRSSVAGVKLAYSKSRTAVISSIVDEHVARREVPVDENIVLRQRNQRCLCRLYPRGYGIRQGTVDEGRASQEVDHRLLVMAFGWRSEGTDQGQRIGAR
jgi:hypothetical protein